MAVDKQHQSLRTAPARRSWRQPEVRRMSAGQAEIGTSNKTDALNTAS
jgi:hypothetical protein